MVKSDHRIRAPDEKKHSGNGYCPKCGSGWVVKNAMTTNIGSQKQNYLCKTCRHRTTAPASKPPAPPVPMRSTLPKAKRYLITAAQNATPIHKAFWQSLMQCSKYYDAEVVVVPGRYKNPTSQWTQEDQKHDWWDPAVVPYLCQGWIQLNERLVIVGDVKVQWAARKPLVGLDALTKDMSGIIGHGSRGLRSIATPQHKHPKLMFTTGACTVANYTDTKAGALGEFNHCLGALIVEIDALHGNAFYVRQLDATRDGSFIDLDMEFTPDKVRRAKPALSLTIGDLHQRWVLPEVVEATFTAPESLVKITNPRYLFWHDVLDFHSRNHHHDDDWVTRYGKWKFGIECVRTEMNEAVHFLNKFTPKGRQSVVVSSNHDRAALKWLKKADFRDDPVNAQFYLECAQRLVESAHKTSGGIAYDDPFVSYAKTLAHENVYFLSAGESKSLLRVEYSFHGDKGPNGSRGSTQNLSKMGIKVTKAHNHVAEIIDACYSVGKSTGMLEYEVGAPSAHTNSHALQYTNGKRTIITIINGRYCLKRPKK